MVISWNLIFTWAVKKTACFLHQFFFFPLFRVCGVCVCAQVHMSRTNLQAYGLCNLLFI